MHQYALSISKSPFKALIGKGLLNTSDVLFVFPQAYMNLSGVPLRKVLDFYKAAPDRLVVIHDDIELPFGVYKKKFGGGHKGHNGIRSIIQETGTPDFYRIRFGVGRPDNPDVPVADYVLSNFNDEELVKIHELAPAIAEELTEVVNVQAGC